MDDAKYDAVYARAATVAEASGLRGIPRVKVERYEDGLALFYGPIGRAYASISVTYDGDLVGLTTDGAGHVVAWEYVFTDETASDAVERVAAFFATQEARAADAREET